MTNAAIKIIASVFALISTICILALPLTFSHLPLDVTILRTTPISETKLSSALEIWGEVTDILLAVAGWIVAVKLWRLNSRGRWLAMVLLADILALMAAQAVLKAERFCHVSCPHCLCSTSRTGRARQWPRKDAVRFRRGGWLFGACMSA